MAFASVEPLRLPETGSALSTRVALHDGAGTTVHVGAYDAARTELRVAILRGQARLERWCGLRGHGEAIVGGFFVRPDGVPLGEVRTRGVERRYVPFHPPWAALRACVHVEGGVAAIAWPPVASTPWPATAARARTPASRWTSWRRSWCAWAASPR